MGREKELSVVLGHEYTTHSLISVIRIRGLVLLTTVLQGREVKEHL